MNIHLALDDKFIDYFIKRQRSNFPDVKNQYVICTNQPAFVHVKSENVKTCSFNNEELNRLLRGENVEKVYIHFFSAFFYDVIADLPGKIKVYWMFWGGDGFGFPTIYPYFLDQYSTRFYRENFFEGKKHKLFNRGFRLKSTWEKYADFRRKNQKALKAFRRVDFFCHYLQADYKLLKKKLRMKARLIDFCYCSYDDLCKDAVQRTTGNNIFIGNSGNEANNHISLFMAINEANLDYDKIFCPLSYAGHPVYLEMVIETGKNLFGDKFIPLLNFMDRDKYNSVVDSCKLFFHNHYRSQAYGNIVYQIHLGKKIYLNSKSALRKFLCDNGINLGEIIGKQIKDPLTIEQNDRILRQLISENELNKKYASVLA